MQLRALFRTDRFSGCSNPRVFIPPFQKDEEQALTLYCAEVPEGARLQLRDKHGVVDLLTLPLPAYLIERINFWNRWSSYALEHEYEYTPALYGLEAYAADIAICISRACPERPVNYCGLPVHDDFALCQHVSKNSISAYNVPHNIPRRELSPLPDGVQPNGHLHRLIQHAEKNPSHLPAEGFMGGIDLEYSYGYMHFDPATEPFAWCGYENSFDLRDIHLPEWLIKRGEEVEIIENDYAYDNMRWYPDLLLLKFTEDALAVDIARHHRPLVPIAMSKRFYAGEDVLTLAAEN